LHFAASWSNNLLVLDGCPGATGAISDQGTKQIAQSLRDQLQQKVEYIQLVNTISYV